MLFEKIKSVLYVTFSLIILSLFYSYSHQNYRIESCFLIPYNDHNKWGFCDTMGNIAIEPRFIDVSFFFEDFHQKTSGNYRSKIQNTNGTNYINTKGEYLFPSDLSFVSCVSRSMSRGCQWEIEKNGKYGLYSEPDSTIIVPVEWDSIISSTVKERVLLVKNTDDITFSRYMPDTKKLLPTNIVDVKEIYLDDAIRKRFKNSVGIGARGEIYKIESGEIKKIDIDVELEDDSRFFKKNRNFTKKNNYPDAKPNPTVLKMVETILESRDYSKNKYVSQYNFTDLYITMKDGKIGMVNENGEVFIEHEYDEIEFSHYDYAVTLHKNGKVGIKQILRETGNLFLLEPKYDDIKLAQTILFDRTPFGKDKRTFMVFEVELNGVKGYVGENGVEYFNFE